MTNKNLEIFDRFYNAHWFLTGYSCRNFSELLREGGNKSISIFIGVMENDVNLMIFNSEQFNKAANFYANKLINNSDWRNKMYKKHDFYLKKYFVAGERLRNLDFKALSNKQIAKELNKISKLQEQVRILGVTLNGLVIDGRGHLTKKLQDELKKSTGNDRDFNDHWGLLTQPTQLSLRQKRDIEIAKLANKNSHLPEKKLKLIYKKYCWLDYMYYGPATPFSEFTEEFKLAKKNNAKLKLEKDLKNLAKRQAALMKKLGFNKRAGQIVGLAQQVLWQKGWRKDTEYHGFYCYEPLLKEVAKRKHIKDWKTLLYAFPWELENVIINNKPSIRELEERRKYSVLVVSNKKIRMLIGQKARAFYRSLNLEKDFIGITETKGQCAFAGKAIGEVKIVQVPKDMAKMNKGDILVSQATSPDLISAMKKAAAIVTNTGGLICHAAITARELKIPCIVGTTNATLIFKDGDMVEVDANKGIVKKL